MKQRAQQVMTLTLMWVLAACFAVAVVLVEVTERDNDEHLWTWCSNDRPSCAP